MQLWPRTIRPWLRFSLAELFALVAAASGAALILAAVYVHPPANDTVRHLNVSPDGSTLAATMVNAHGDSRVEIWRLADRQRLSTFPAEGPAVLSHDGAKVLTVRKEKMRKERIQSPDTRPVSLDQYVAELRDARNSQVLGASGFSLSSPIQYCPQPVIAAPDEDLFFVIARMTFSPSPSPDPWLIFGTGEIAREEVRTAENPVLLPSRECVGVGWETLYSTRLASDNSGTIVASYPLERWNYGLRDAVLAASHDGRYLAAADGFNIIVRGVRTAGSAEFQANFGSVDLGYSDQFDHPLAFRPNSYDVLYRARDELLLVTKTSKPVTIADNLSMFACGQRGDYIAGARGGEIRLWDAATLEETTPLNGIRSAYPRITLGAIVAGASLLAFALLRWRRRGANVAPQLSAP